MPETIIDILKESSKKYKDHVAFQMKRDDRYETYTYEEITYAAAKFAKELISLGCKKGDRVAILSENRPEWGISYFAILSSGGVVVPLDSRLRQEEIANLLKDSETKILIVSQNFLAMQEGLKAEVPSLKSIVVLDEFSFRNREAFDWPKDINPDDLAEIVYTSGTTGRPKGVMLTHKNLASNAAAGGKVIRVEPTDNLLSILPLYHTFETTAGFLIPLSAGARMTYAESLKSDKLVKNMQDTGVTLIAGVPLLYQLFYDGILRNVKEKGILIRIIFHTLYGISWLFGTLFNINIGRKLFSFIHKRFGGKIRFFASGGAYISPKLIRNYACLGFPIVQGYGLTETSPVLSCTSLEKNRTGSVGFPLPGVTIKLANPDKDGVGEIIAQGPNVMKGYYRKPEETAEVIKGGWFYTGDLGRFDKEGNLFIVGRSKDVIVTGSGMNVHPDEVEEKLGESPFIAEACIVSKKIKGGIKAGMEEVYAVIFPHQEHFAEYAEKNEVALEPVFIKNILAAEIKKYNENVTEYKRIAGFSIRDAEFPKTALKKIKRFEIREEVNR